MKDAIEADMAEVKMGQLAHQKEQSQDVKRFGQTLQQDHGQHLQQAQQIGLTPPSKPNAKQKQSGGRQWQSGRQINGSKTRSDPNSRSGQKNLGRLLSSANVFTSGH